MRYDRHKCIAVHHRTGVEFFECKSFVDAAIADGWGFNTINDIFEAIECFGSQADIPAELADMIENGPVIEVTYPNGCNEYLPESAFRAEEAAKEFLARDLSQLIVIDSTEDAVEVAKSYNNHEKYAVRKMARQILAVERMVV